jgi:hypothetical protein
MELDNRKRDVDRWLNAAMKQYSSIEPRSNLEKDILRGLRTAQDRSTPRMAWLVFAAAMVALVVAGALISMHHGDTQQVAIERTTPVASGAKNPAETRQTSPPLSVISTSVRKKTPRPHATEAKAQSWPAQFPTPHPLTEQERLLAEYVRERPQEARVVARARAEMAKQDMLMFEHPEQQAPNSEP